MVKKKKAKPASRKALVRTKVKAKTKPKFKIPDLVSGKFAVVGEDGFQSNDQIFNTEGEAEAELARLKALPEPEDGIPDQAVTSAKVKPLGKFMTTSFLVDDAGAISARLDTKENAVTLRQAVSGAIREQRGYFKELAADFKAATKERALAQKTHAASLARAKKALAAFEKKVARYGA